MAAHHDNSTEKVNILGLPYPDESDEGSEEDQDSGERSDLGDDRSDDLRPTVHEESAILHDSAVDAYPDTDAQFDGGAVDAYPDTDAQFDGGGATSAHAATAAGAQQAAPTSASADPAASAAPPVAQGWQPPAWSHPPIMLPAAAVEEWVGGVFARSMPLAERKALVLGRHGGMADVVVADPSVSRAHAAVICTAEAVFAHDLASAHGSMVERAGSAPLRLEPSSAPQQLREGDVLRVGQSSHAFRVVGLSPREVERFQVPAWASLPRGQPSLEVLETSKKANPYLEHLGGSAGVAEVIPIHDKRCYVLGRNAHFCDIVVRHESVSRQHAAIVHDDDCTYVIDCGSATGTFLNNEDCRPHKAERMTDGMMLSLGGAPITYTLRRGAPAASGAGKRTTATTPAQGGAGAEGEAAHPPTSARPDPSGVDPPKRRRMLA